MDEHPPLSVVIPTRDTRDLTLRCLESLRWSGASSIEVLVVDDASTDGTGEAISERYPTAAVVRNSRSQGFTASANRGLSAARGEVVLLLNSDTEVKAGALEILLDWFHQRREMGVGGALLHYPDGSPQWSAGPIPSVLWLFALASGLPAFLWRLPGYGRLRRRLRSTPTTGSQPQPVAWVTGAAMAIRRQVLQAVGPLDERFRLYAQDADLCLRVRDLGWEVCLIPGFRVLHHRGSTIGAGKGGSALARQPPGILWTDLIRLIQKRRGHSAARRAAWALRWGATLRLVARWLVSPFVRLPARREWREETQIIQRARARCR